MGMPARGMCVVVGTCGAVHGSGGLHGGGGGGMCGRECACRRDGH